MAHMAERRSLIDGLKSTPAPMDVHKQEKEFVYAEKEKAAEAKAPPAPTVPAISRVPISTRMRSDYAKALKNASLQRQLNGTEPNTLQDILEEAVEPWLKSNGYLS